jgi:pyruvate dehydrogenase E1 component
MASFTAAGSAYATHGVTMVPFYIFYSMFGFQRTMDLIWAAADQRARGFLLGATAGRTTLNGEGLQHQDGHSLLLAAAMPNVRSYDPAFAYELALIVQDGLRRMVEQQEDCFYYVTLYNENFAMPPQPAGVDEGVLKGLYLFRAASTKTKTRSRIFASGTVFENALAAQRILGEKYGVAADVYSATSYQLLRDECQDAERWNRLHPTEPPRKTWLNSILAQGEGPIVAVSDFVKGVPDLIGRYVDARFVPLGTDGFGRSDTRERLRHHFEIDTPHIVLATLNALARDGKVKAEVVATAIRELGLDAEHANPRTA